MSYFVYRLESDRIPQAWLTLDGAYSARLWKPRGAAVVPPGAPYLPFAVWWAMHQGALFRNRDYGVFVVYADGRLVHRSGVFPGYLRFPFMAAHDVQIGDTWTDPAHRGRGLASFAIQQILAEARAPGRAFWYLAEQGNLPSVRTIEKFGFVRVGEGARRKRFGLRTLGYFAMHPPGVGSPSRLDRVPPAAGHRPW